MNPVFGNSDFVGYWKKCIGPQRNQFINCCREFYVFVSWGLFLLLYDDPLPPVLALTDRQTKLTNLMENQRDRQKSNHIESRSRYSPYRTIVSLARIPVPQTLLPAPPGRRYSVINLSLSLSLLSSVISSLSCSNPMYLFMCVCVLHFFYYCYYFCFLGSLVTRSLSISNKISCYRWFDITSQMRQSPNYAFLSDEMIARMERNRTWLEFKVISHNYE